MSKVLKKLRKQSTEIASTGLTLGVSGAIVGRASGMSSHVAPLSGSIGTLGSFAGMASNFQAGKTVMDSLKPYKRKKKKY